MEKMSENLPESYKPVPLAFRENWPNHKMISISENHLNVMEMRRTIRDFSNKAVPYSVIENCLKVACSAPSGANRQPWHFCVISNPLIKSKIRSAAELEEQKFYSDIKKDDWLKALEPIGTHADKPHLETAPWLIVVFAERYGEMKDGSQRKNYYVPESVGIATGFLISSLHLSGLHCLTHTPSPMTFLQKICKRPLSNKASLILAVGHASNEARIPLAATIKKPFMEVVSTL
jgi:nitroreductase